MKTKILKLIMTLPIVMLLTITQSYSKDKQPSIVVEGVYSGQNIFVSNPYSGEGNGFAVQKILLNGKVMHLEIQSSTFEIDLKKLKAGDKVKLEIQYSASGAAPKVINPEALTLKERTSIILEGTYAGKNIYVTNPYSNAGGFTVKQVLINGKSANVEINSSAFEIDLKKSNIGEKIKIEIEYDQDGSLPKILNPEVLK